MPTSTDLSAASGEWQRRVVCRCFSLLLVAVQCNAFFVCAFLVDSRCSCSPSPRQIRGTRRHCAVTSWSPASARSGRRACTPTASMKREISGPVAPQPRPHRGGPLWPRPRSLRRGRCVATQLFWSITVGPLGCPKALNMHVIFHNSCLSARLGQLSKQLPIDGPLMGR